SRRKQMEEALRQSEARYRTLFENAGDAILIHDLEGRFLAANNLACQRLGYSLEELRWLGPADVEAPEYAARLGERIEALRRYGHHFFETVHIRRDGGTIPVELSSRLIEYEGQPAVLSIARDVTERRQMQQVLLRTERMAAMGHLAAALAHEINNPLQSVSSSIELVLDFPLEEPERQEYLVAVRHEIERLMSVTGRILDFARPTSTEREAIPVGEVVRYALSLADKQFEHSRISIGLDLPPDLPPVVASRDELAQVFLNLVINALEAMPGGGRLEISARAADGKLDLCFDDSGPGISPAMKERLFEPFQTSKKDGTGLGLALSYSIIQQHGGNIAAGDAPGGGARFCITLPHSGSRTQGDGEEVV
ncbi:MAG: PAS domain S-box protein, partial [Anaerolineae bacterium]